MKNRIMLVTFSAGILRDAVVELQKKGIEIIYWTGYKSEFEQFSKDKKQFPTTIFHDNYDALRCIPATDIDISVFPAVPKFVFDYMAQYRVQALSLMERNNISGLELRQLNHLFNEHVQYWYGVLITLRIDSLIFSNIPHVANNFIIFHVAKAMGLKTVIFHTLKIPTRVMVTDDYREHALLFDAYKNRLEQTLHVTDLPADIIDYYNKQHNEGDDATPFYIKKEYINMRARANNVFPSVKSIISNIRRLTIVKTAIKYIRMLLGESTKVLTLEGKIVHRGIAYKRMQHMWVKAKRSYMQEYKTMESTPDYTVPYIYIPLHNQPELNTNPLGGIFDDQLLLIEMIAKTAPKGWKLYVKETQLQWKWPLGHLGRYRGYYNKIAAIPNVVILPTTISSFDLIRSSKTVATISGTAGWEALFRGKPALVFGLVWYRYCDGVFQISGKEDLESAFAQIEKGRIPDKNRIIQFLAAVGDVTVKAKLDKRFEVQGLSASYDETVSALAEAWIKEIQHDR